MSPPSLPVIPIAAFLPTTTDAQFRQATAKALHDACRDYGFFYLNIEGFVDASETDELTDLARQFFSRPQDEKDKLSLRHSDQARGYARLNENVTNGKADAHEGIDFYRPVEHIDNSQPLQGENQWPSDIPHFRERYTRWTEKMQQLGIIVMEAMATGLGLTQSEWGELRSKVDHSFWVMRIIGYPPLPSGHDGISCGAHKDYGCLTFLYADSTPSALQVYLRNGSLLTGALDEIPGEGGIWIDADPLPGCFVCNIGEMWEVWTKGLYKSTLHRVIHLGSNYRISIPFFYEPNFTARISPLAAVDRITEEKDTAKLKAENSVEREEVVYGEFLMKKVAGNFTEGSGKYN